MKNQLIIFGSYILVFVVGGCTKCDDSKFKSKECYMVVVNKTHENELRYIVIEGIDLNGKKSIFKEIGLSDIYNNLNPGDTLIKQRGSTVITIAKKRKRAEFPKACGDGYLKNPEWIPTKP